MMDMAHTPVPRKKIPIFGNYWLIGGAMVGVAITSVLLTLAVLQQSETKSPDQDVAAPSGKKLEEQEAMVHPKDVLLGNSIDLDEQRKEPTPTKPQFTFYESLLKMEIVIPEEEPLTHIKQRPIPAIEEPTNLAVTDPSETYYLQAGSFRDKKLADKLKLELAWLGFNCEIHKTSIL